MATSSVGRLRLSRSMRLQSSRDFLHTREVGRRKTRGCLVLNWCGADGGVGSRLGVIASRRVGPAVVRNRARRLLREAFRLHQGLLRQPLSIVLVARPSIAGLSFGEVERDYLAVLRDSGLLVGNS
ncbi:MAG: ribonuclease P protein component [Limisphaerales bacterium]